MKSIIFHFAVISIALASMLSSCEKPEGNPVSIDNKELERVTGSGVPVEINVLDQGEFSTTKSVVGMLRQADYGDCENLCISEYVGDIESQASCTRGYEIKTSNIASIYGRFQALAYLKGPAAPGQDTLIDQKYFDLQSSYDSSRWRWCENGSTTFLSDSLCPRWLTNTPMTVWSYAPVGAGAGDLPGTIAPDGIDSSNLNKINFDYKVQADPAEQKDILFAYNVETREFRKDAQGKYEVDANGVITSPFVDGQDQYYDVHFLHALSAVKFELGTGMENVDIKSIKISSVADSAHCAVTGSGTGTGNVSFKWTGHSAPREWTISYGEGQSVAGGYASSQGGVLFMIPQEQSDVTISVEFTKFGSSTSIKRHITIPGIKWEAGKYYVYKLSGTIHVPGEVLFGTQQLTVSKFKGGSNKNIFSTSIPLSGGIKKVGVIATDYYLKDNGATTLVIAPAPDGVVSTLNASSLPAQVSFQYNFLDLDPDLESSTTANAAHVYAFGLTDTSTETYYSNYYMIYNLGTETTEKYMVFDTEGWSSFNLTAVTTSTNNGNDFSVYIKALLILEVQSD